MSNPLYLRGLLFLKAYQVLKLPCKDHPRPIQNPTLEVVVVNGERGGANVSATFRARGGRIRRLLWGESVGTCLYSPLSTRKSSLATKSDSHGVLMGDADNPPVILICPICTSINAVIHIADRLCPTPCNGQICQQCPFP